MPKTHYATVERGNESNPYDEWSGTLCGLDYTESPLSNNIKHVDCKRCLRAFENYDRMMTEYLTTETYPIHFMNND